MAIDRPTGLKIDLKGDAETYHNYCGAVDVEKVWRNAANAMAMGIHIEIVNLVATGVSDRKEQIESLVDRHLRELRRLIARSIISSTRAFG